MCRAQFYTCHEFSYSKGTPWVSSICTLESLSLSLPSPVLWRLAHMKYITILPCTLASHWICPVEDRGMEDSVVRVSHWSPCDQGSANQSITFPLVTVIGSGMIQSKPMGLFSWNIYRRSVISSSLPGCNWGEDKAWICQEPPVWIKDSIPAQSQKQNQEMERN